jgi:hypothetical protein
MRFVEKFVAISPLLWALSSVGCSGKTSSRADGGPTDSHEADRSPDHSEASVDQAGSQADVGLGAPDMADIPSEAPADAGQAGSDAADGSLDASANSGTDAGDALGDDGPINPMICGQMCEVVEALACSVRPTMDACLTTCLSEASICPTETAAYYHCLSIDGTAALMCNPIVGAIRRTGFCDDEAANVGTCIANQ